jgi:hypothetical protein
MQTRTYGDLFKLIQSLAGVGSFAASEQDDIANFINRRFSEAYDTSDMWPRYLVTGEERQIWNEETSASFFNPTQNLNISLAGNNEALVPYEQNAKVNIGEFIRIHRTHPFLRNSALEFEFYVDGIGAHILNLTTADASSAFVTYKKEFTPFSVSSDYQTSTAEVPAEFFHFIAHTAYADFLRMDGQTDKALIEEQAGGNYLALELEKVDIKMNNNTVNKRFSTHGNRQAR